MPLLHFLGQTYKHFKGIKYTSGENDRKFLAWTGVTPAVAEYIFINYQHPDFLPNRSRVLIVLHFLKASPTEDEGSSDFKISSRTTYRKYLWNAIDYLSNSMKEEININNRFSSFVPTTGIFANCSLIGDGTDCPVDRPTKLEDRLKYSNGRSKENTYGKYGIKYTVFCQITTGEICAVMGPEPGRISDIQGLRNGETIGILSELNDDIILADKGYQGHPKCLTPVKGTCISPYDEVFNEILASVRILVECVIQRLKIFGILGRKGRFRNDIFKHKNVFMLVCQITNISMREAPVWQNKNWFLEEEEEE
jgi:hypothetical protein